MRVQGVADSDVSKPARGRSRFTLVPFAKEKIHPEQVMGTCPCLFVFAPTMYYKDDSCWCADLSQHHRKTSSAYDAS
ncbi:hypothetical protein Tco_0480619 [Tanacetum coccineum]